MKVNFVLFQDSKALKRGQFEYRANGRGLSSDVDNAVLGVSHTSVTSTFQGQLLLSNTYFLSVHDVCPSKPAPLPKLKLTRVRMREFSDFKRIIIITYSVISCPRRFEARHSVRGDTPVHPNRPASSW